MQTLPPESTLSVDCLDFIDQFPAPFLVIPQHFTTLLSLLLHIALKISESCQPQLLALPSVVSVSSKFNVA